MTEDAVSDLAASQWGMITRRQARDLGMTQTRIARWAENGRFDRVAHGVYRLAGAPAPDHIDLRAAWLQLAPAIVAWSRSVDQGVVSHRSAADLFGFGHLPANRYEFTFPERHQSKREDVRIHVRRKEPIDLILLRGLPVTTACRTASDLLLDKEDPGAVAQFIVDALRSNAESAGDFVRSLKPRAAALGFRRGDGMAVLLWLLDLSGGHDKDRWIEEANVTSDD